MACTCGAGWGTRARPPGPGWPGIGAAISEVLFETEMTHSMRPEAQEAIRAMIPLGRRGDPHELACAVRFLLADEASYITGSVVTVDGGLSIGA